MILCVCHLLFCAYLCVTLSGANHLLGAESGQENLVSTTEQNSPPESILPEECCHLSGPENFCNTITNPNEAESPSQEDPPPFSNPWTTKDKPIEGEISYQQAVTRMIGALGLLLTLLFISVIALKRATSGKLFYQKKKSSGDVLEILGHTVLSPKSIVYLLQVGEHRVVITESHADVSVDTLCLSLQKESKKPDPESFNREI